MEAVAVAIVCAATFGMVAILSDFVKKLSSSREKNLNDNAQQRAIVQKAKEWRSSENDLERLKRFESYYQLLVENKEAIHYLRQKIEDLFKKKSYLIHRFTDMAIKEAKSMVGNELAIENKRIYDRTKKEIANELALYNSQLEKIQIQRQNLWLSSLDVHAHLLEQEKTYNDYLDSFYQLHSEYLEKVYCRNSSSKYAIFSNLEPYFEASTAISKDQVGIENKLRRDVIRAQYALNANDDCFFEKMTQHSEKELSF